MNDEIKHNEGEEEFQFTEIEEPELFGPEKRPPPWQSSLNRRNLIILVGVLITALAIYKLWGVFTAPPKPKPPAVVHPAAVITPPPPPTASADIVRMQQQMVVERERVNSLEGSVNNLANNMTSMQQSLDSIKSQLNELMTMFKTQQAEIQALKPKPKPKVKVDFCPPIVKLKKEKLKFYVKAIVPGRAWVVAANGLTLTVAEGDVLPGYGKIVEVSPVRSIVVTSSGAIIRYRVNVSTSSSPYI